MTKTNFLAVVPRCNWECRKSVLDSYKFELNYIDSSYFFGWIICFVSLLLDHLMIFLGIYAVYRSSGFGFSKGLEAPGAERLGFVNPLRTVDFFPRCFSSMF